MVGKQLDGAVTHLEKLFGTGTALGQADDELLGRFLARRDDAAFEALVRRHGPMVVAVCRGVLRDENDVQDAFQATFLVLVRKARSIRAGTSLGGWLCRVAYNLALQINTRAARRRRREAEAAAMAEHVGGGRPRDDEQVAALHEEIGRLPEKYRLAVVACHLEQMTHAEAARHLGWTEGMVRGRASRARERLRRNLARRGMVLSSAALASWLSARSAGAASAALAARWTDVTVRAAAVFAAGGVPTGTVSAAAVAFSEEMVRGMLMTKLKLMAIALLATGGPALVAALVMAGPPRPAGPGGPAAARAPVPGQASTSFGGVVVDAAGGKPAAGTAVVVRRALGDQPGGEHRVESDAAGRFQLELPAGWEARPDARLAVTVQAPPGFVGFPYRTQYGSPTDEGITLAELRREQELGVPPYFGTLLLFPTRRVEGRVAAPDGTPAAGVEVVACSVHLKDKASPPHRLVRRTRTGADGRFEAEVASPGPAVIYYLTDRYAPRAVKLTDPEGDLGVCTLEAGVEVHGKVVDSRGQPIANRWVRVGVTADPFKVDNQLWHVGLGSVERWCRTISGGSFRTAPLAPGDYEASVHGPGRDKLGDRARIGEPLEASVVPQAVSVPARGEMPRTVLRAVPHVVVDVRVADRDGKPPRCRVTFPFFLTFNGKECSSMVDTHAGMPIVDGRLRLFIPHGASELKSNGVNFGEPAVGYSFKSPASERGRQQRDNGTFMWPHILELSNVEADRVVDVEWTEGVDVSLKVTAAGGRPPADLPIPDVRHSNEEPCWAVPVGEGVYRPYGVRADTPFTVTLSPEGKEKVTRSYTVAAGQPRRLEIALEGEQ